MRKDFARDSPSWTKKSSSHPLFERFIEKKLTRDAEGILQKQRVTPEQVRALAELAAFAIVDDATLGLNPRRDSLLEALRRWREPDGSEHRMLDALEQLHLIRGDAVEAQAGQARLTFSHRRFQEYFATCYALRSPGAVTEQQLLFDPRWRETAAVLLRSGEAARLERMLTAAHAELQQGVESLEQRGMCAPTLPDNTSGRDDRRVSLFPWPPKSLHVLALLHDAFLDDPGRLPDGLRVSATAVINSAFTFGRLADRRMALEVAGILNSGDLIALLRGAISFGSDLLDDTAFRMVRLISPVPTDLSRWIRVTMVRRLIEGRLHREYRTMEALLSRVRDNGALSSAIRLLANVKRIDVLCHAVWIAAFFTLGASWLGPVGAVVLAVVSCLASPLCMYLGHSMLGQVRNKVAVNPNLENPILKRLFVGPAPEFMESHALAMFAIMLLFLRGTLGLFLRADLPTVGAWVFLVCWAPMGILAVLSGEITARRWWPIVTAFPLIFLIKHPGTVGRHIAKYGWRYAIGIFVIGWSSVIPNWMESDQSGMVVAILLLFSLVVWLPFTVIMFIGPCKWLADWLRLRRSRQLGGRLAFADFLQALDSYCYPSFRIRFIRSVSARTLLGADRQTLGALQELTLTVEQDISARRLTSNTLRALRMNFGHLWPGGKVPQSVAVLDELVRLEQRLTEMPDTQRTASADERSVRV